MAEPYGEVNIELDDLKELARINPVAWEQLIHIADNRQNTERIKELEGHLEQAHKYAQGRAMASVNGLEKALSET